MSWQTKYRVAATSFNKGDEWWADIQEEGWAGGVVELRGSARPIVIKYVDNGETKYPTIQASFCEISFVSDTFDLESIISSDDKKYRVSIYRNEELQWRGFLSTDDCQEEYTDGNRTFVLTATDGLGFLKEESWKFRTGESGKDTYGWRSLLDVLADCLHYTYTELDIYIQCNVYDASMSEFGWDNPFDQSKLHTKLFLFTDAGPKNMYEILEVLMEPFQTTIFQQGGIWIVRRKPDSFDTQSDTNKLYSWPDLTSEQVTKRWSTDRGVYFTPINGSHLRTFVKPTSNSIYTHNYLMPDTPENEDWQDGELVSSDADKRVYSVDFWNCWAAPLTSPVAVDGFYRVEEIDANENLKEWYIEFPCYAPSGRPFIANEFPILVDPGDTITTSGEVKINEDISGPGSGPIVYYRLFGEDGNVYTYSGPNKNWQITLVSMAGAAAVEMYYDNSSGAGKSNTYQSWENTSSAFPVAGDLYIYLTSFVGGSGDTVYFKNFQCSINLYFEGGTRTNIGERSTSSLDIISRKKNEKTIRLGDAPKRVIASALWRNDATELTAKWKRLADSSSDRLLNINSQDLQKSTWRVFNKIDGDFMGCIGPNGIIGPANLFNMVPPEYVVYIATNMEIDPVNDRWTASLQEFRDRSANSKDRDQTYYNNTEFKYLFNERS